jgi:hypothetical protein
MTLRSQRHPWRRAILEDETCGRHRMPPCERCKLLPRQGEPARVRSQSAIGKRPDMAGRRPRICELPLAREPFLFHDEGDLFQHGDVAEGIALDGDEVGGFGGLE